MRQLTTRQQQLYQQVVDVTKFSSIRRLLLVTAFVLRFKNNLINKWKRKEHLIVTGDIHLEEINHAEELWVKREQFTIEKGVKYENLKKSLRLFTDDSGLLRLKGRFGNSDLSFEEKHPLLLRSDSYFTELLISNAHSTVKHSGMEATLNQLRLRFWVTKGRQTVKNVISKCVICKHLSRENHLHLIYPATELLLISVFSLQELILLVRYLSGRYTLKMRVYIK